MRKFRNLPAVLTLLAGFITSVVMIMSQYTLVHFLWVLVLVMTVFFVISQILVIILNRVFKDKSIDEYEESSVDNELLDGAEEKLINGDMEE